MVRSPSSTLLSSLTESVEMMRFRRTSEDIGTTEVNITPKMTSIATRLIRAQNQGFLACLRGRSDVTMSPVNRLPSTPLRLSTQRAKEGLVGRVGGHVVRALENSVYMYRDETAVTPKIT